MQMQRSGERGSATLKFVIVMAILCSAAYAGYLYIPVALQANTYKDLMQHYADVAVAQGYPPSWAGEAHFEVPAALLVEWFVALIALVPFRAARPSTG